MAMVSSTHETLKLLLRWRNLRSSMMKSLAAVLVASLGNGFAAGSLLKMIRRSVKAEQPQGVSGCTILSSMLRSEGILLRASDETWQTD